MSKKAKNLKKRALKNQQIIIKTYTKRQKYKTMSLYLFIFFEKLFMSTFISSGSASSFNVSLFRDCFQIFHTKYLPFVGLP